MNNEKPRPIQEDSQTINIKKCLAPDCSANATLRVNRNIDQVIATLESPRGSNTDKRICKQHAQFLVERGVFYNRKHKKESRNTLNAKSESTIHKNENDGLISSEQTNKSSNF